MKLQALGKKTLYVLVVLALGGWLISSRLKQDRSQAAEALHAFDVALCQWTRTHEPAPVLAQGREAARRAPASPEALLAHQLASALGPSTSTLPKSERPLVDALRARDLEVARERLAEIDMPERRRALYQAQLTRLDALLPNDCALP